jgi:uncharacterized protein
MASDSFRIESLDQLRTIFGEPSALASIKVMPAFDEFARAFVARSPFLLMSTADADGNQDCSPKGDEVGFVEVEDDTTLLIPDRSGNRLLFGLQNLLQNPHIGLIFLVPGTGETLRVNGTAEITNDPAILQRLHSRGRPAQVAIRVHIRECFFHCAKAFLRSHLWEPAAWGAPHRVSFGKIMQKKFGSPDAIAEQIDATIEENYRLDV